jgi:hypothetical protein
MQRNGDSDPKFHGAKMSRDEKKKNSQIKICIALMRRTVKPEWELHFLYLAIVSIHKTQN